MNALSEEQAAGAAADTAEDRPFEPAGDAPSERPSIGQAVGKAAGLMHSGALSTGDLAELRRISPDRPYTPALWKVLHLTGQEDAPGWIGQARWERRWATQLMGMAFCVDPARSLHDYGVPLGRALLTAGWSELRFVRLLRAEGEALEVELRRVAQYLASKSQPANWADVADLLFAQTGDLGEKIRLRIARRYYRALHAKEQTA